MKIGIIGQGFVGNAIYQKFKNYFDVKTYDLKRNLSNASFEEVVFTRYYICLFTYTYGK